MNRLVYDARHITAEFTGLARYSATLLTTLLATANRPDFEVDVLLPLESELVGNGLHNGIRSTQAATPCRFHHVAVKPITFGHHLKLPLALGNQFAGAQYFYPHFDPPLGLSLPITFVVHDLIPLKVDGYVQRHEALKRLYFKTMIRAATRRAQRCIAVSRTTCADLRSILPPSAHAKLEVVYEGPLLPNGDGDTAAAAPLIGGPYLLYVGDRRPHKNLPKVIALFQQLRERHGYRGRLVLAGSTRNFGVDIDRLLQPQDAFVVTGPVPDATLRRLYHHADATLLLSAYEGFGLPVVEAVRCGSRVIVSDGGSLPEIAPPEALVLPLQSTIDQWAIACAHWLREAVPTEAADYLPRFDWADAARQIFPTAYNAPTSTAPVAEALAPPRQHS